MVFDPGAIAHADQLAALEEDRVRADDHTRKVMEKADRLGACASVLLCLGLFALAVAAVATVGLPIAIISSASANPWLLLLGAALFTKWLTAGVRGTLNRRIEAMVEEALQARAAVEDFA